MEIHSKEARIVLAIEAIELNKRLTIRKAANYYSVPRSTLFDRIQGRSNIAESRPKSHNLTELEEKMLIQYIIDMDDRGFAPKLNSVEDMANYMLETRGAKKVGKLWAHRFVKRRSELKTRFNRVYDFQRALCEDPELIEEWFRLVSNMRAKYGIQDCDFYNFDETGFMMGIICPGMVVINAERSGRSKAIQPGNREWAIAIICGNGEGETIPPFLVVQGQYHLSNWYIESDFSADWAIKPTSNGWMNNEIGLEWLKHFDKHTSQRRKGKYRMLVLDGHESHESIPFQSYCKSNDIICIKLPLHSSHLTQPLDIGCFSVLKRSYSCQIEGFIKAYINHISKIEFFIAFKAAYQQSITIQNIKAGFRGAGLIPFDPQSILSKLDIRIRTSTPPSTSLELTNFWISQTPHNPTEALLQSTLVKARIARHQSSSPTPIFETVQALAKGTERLAYEVTLLSAENRMLRRANEALSKRRHTKKIQLCNGGVLTGQEAEDILSQQEVDNQIQRDERQNGGNSNRESSTSRCCSKCGKTGHNSRTCQNNAIDASLLDS
ncbi:hypothetical protein SS1G_07383 [Sclerotinia sclerotiorum 1980 UF-70]|uniref:HTH CENPB-type domain-containing protein n=2 Tax=Sclerotinia sclerotiorum (strain ATCC 18683 / 1980 / Ss-1) TaxID=665079 RepID=A7EPY4_SCLS1|nr:hypothetical protein SS1G_07383 [Sclerotinia sclerotiorum 1980 UF-70]APA10190.1 hypothetical protein sscle_06g049600 [Sclerotinia sclerotiorum 1980 UF-70]EDO04900.1 hypothetical protein SS1G_07383 [Sclerotinia sclerotiorum 1980 UF-70]